VILLRRRSRPPPETSPADDVVGVEAAVEDGAGGLGNWALERRRAVFEKPGLNRPAVEWLPVFGFESFWDGLRGSSAEWAFPMMARTDGRAEQGVGYAVIARPCRKPGESHAWLATGDTLLHVWRCGGRSNKVKTRGPAGEFGNGIAEAGK
jgi:hypothetical protein